MEVVASFIFSILVFTLVVNSILSFFVYKNNPRSATNIIFYTLCWITSIWLVVMYLSLHPKFISISLYLDRFSIFFAVPQVLLLFLLSHTLPHKKLGLDKVVFYVLLVIGTALMVITISPYAFENIEVVNNSPRPIVSWGMVPFAIFTVLLSLLSIYRLFTRIKHSSGLERQQLQFVMLGILLMLSLIIITILIPVLLFNSTIFVPLAPIYVLTFLGLTTYSIVKHRLLNIRLIVARSVAYSISILLLGLLYAMAIFVVSTFFTGQAVNRNNLITSIVLALVIALSFPWLKRRLEKLTAKVFYKDLYDSNRLLGNLSRIMASTFVLSDLAEFILKELTTQMKISHSFLILTRNSSIIWVKGAGNVKHPEFDEKQISHLIESVVQNLGENIWVFEEMAESAEKNIMREDNISIVLPLAVKDEIIGGLLFGEKSSGDIYSVEDINMFKIVAPEIAVAVKNALSYEEIKRFTITLEEEVKQATEKLKIANERLKELDVLKDEFVSVASHELRTPMTAIKSYLWLALYGKESVSEKMRYYLARSFNSTNRLIKLVNDMLNVSRIESGRITIDAGEVKMDELVRDVLAEIAPRAQELDIALTAVEYPNLPSVIADDDKIKEVLINLIGNSLKFTPKGGSVKISFALKDNFVETSVADTGEGIEQADLSRLFRKFGFVRGSYATNQKASQGTGLGLYISKSIVDLHGGTMSVASPGRGQGATFTFSLKQFTPEALGVLQAAQKDKEGLGIIHSGL